MTQRGLEMCLSQRATAAVLAMSEQERIVDTQLLAAAWVLFLSRYGGTEEVAQGATVYRLTGDPAWRSWVHSIGTPHGVESRLAGRRLNVRFAYGAEILQEHSLSRITEYLNTMLSNAVANPGAPLSSLEMLPEVERKQLLWDWNRTDAFFPVDECIHTQLERQVDRNPAASAVVFQGNELTYRELDERANQLARRLVKLGVGPETLVGICMDRSLDLMVALMAVLKAGGAYLPLDPTYPAARMEMVLADAQPRVILTQQRLVGTLSSWPHSIAVDSEGAITARESTARFGPRAMPENLAYVIYTSGSTGKPKGVMIEQRNVVSFFTAMDHCFGSLQPAVWLAITSISFDISVLELFWTLARGHQVVIQDGEGSLLDGDYSIARQIRRYGVSHLQCTPSLLRMLMSNRDSIDALRRLKTLLVGGEALPVALVEQVRQTLSATIHNMYGPTETTIWSTTHRVEETKGTIPIGRPIANTHTYILDALQRPVPAGGIGQLYIGGAGVARGYFNRSELTAEQFRQDPFRGKPGSRIYCTGDLARYRPDGVIEYLGRADSQVKIRGYRIELGEIETALDRYPGVRQAAVAVRDDEASDKRLVAYVVLDSPAPNAAELRRYLRDQLPAYMAPAVFVRLDAMPLTDNGKVNRKALPAPEGIAMSSFETAYEGPSKGIEQTVADLWREALDVERVNINANFFDLGAHSLMVAEVHAKLQETLNCEIPLVTMFRYPTVSLLAGHLSKEEDKDGVLGKSAGRAQTRTESYRRRVGRRDAV